jgi:hypothetical protein
MDEIKDIALKGNLSTEFNANTYVPLLCCAVGVVVHF